MRLILRSREKWTLLRLNAWSFERKKKKKTAKWTLLRFTLERLNAKSEKNLGFEKWKNAKYCVQNPVRLGQSRLDNKLLMLKRVGKVENWKWKTFAVQTILQKQTNMVKVVIGSVPDSSENARSSSSVCLARDSVWYFWASLYFAKRFSSTLLLKKTVEKGKRWNWKESLSEKKLTVFGRALPTKIY